MDIAGILASLEASGPATTIRNSLYWFPLIEAFHVLGLATVFGTIAVIDLRLLGLASSNRSFTKLAGDVFRWTWAGFALAVVTGTLMFITNAAVYYNNFFFRAKMVMLLLAGINIVIFELTAARSLHRWDKERAAPTSGRAVAAASLLLWVAIIFAGRWIGFTTSQTDVPLDENINFDELFPPPADGGGAPQ